jgi:cobalt-precorrin-5B (C1)-methyltransferase
LVAQGHLQLPEESYVMMGDYVGHALTASAAKGVRNIIIAGQFAKLLKIACGHTQTHVASSELDLRMLKQWVDAAGCGDILPGSWRHFNTARQVLEASGNDPRLVGLLCERVKNCAEKLAPGFAVKVLLAGYDGKVLYFR